MFSFVRRSTLSALICLGGIATTPHIASAQMQFELDEQGGRVIIGPDCRRESNRYDPRCRDEYRRDYRGERRGCSPEQALDKAERLGLRRVRIEDVGRRFIEVSGRSEGRRVLVTFARERGCPVLRR
ncbi:hypothetical protein C7441_104214 [Pseudaminobacter salicylatoxidans]|uniref:YpeB-like protein with protease inhibitory function n=1 Tax=Pseudaminobacter salicylatoxidans TaxID=93369 RepID=A0A316C7A4_PSESE|nr:hypothetical protein [Pseudaminobacter salicylatoxidans]PWJ84946.1 hypothetical protein C7441_104214 [Pseudaminobacter salicylatoxidans]